MPTCTAKTAAGNACKGTAILGTKSCMAHSKSNGEDKCTETTASGSRCKGKKMNGEEICIIHYRRQNE